MLLKTKITNFQALRDVEIDHGGLTVITGQSDLGKSAIIRACRLLHRNNGGMSFIRHGKQKLRVEQVYSGSSVVSIEKSKTVNGYQVNGSRLSKVGKEVPDPVREVLNTDELVLDKDVSCDLNFSGQFDGLFLLTESSTMVTKVVSAISGVEIIYGALREGVSRQQKVKSTAQALAGTVAALARFEGLQPGYESLCFGVKSLESMEDALGSSEAVVLNMESLLARASALGSKTIDVAPLESLFIEVSVLLAQVSKTSESLGLLEALGQRVRALRSVEVSGDLDVFKGLLSEYSVLEGLRSQWCTLSALGASLGGIGQVDLSSVSQLDDTRGKLVSIFSLVKSQEQGYSYLEGLHKSLESLDSDQSRSLSEMGINEKLEAELREKLKVCPTCGRPL
jgi:ABC-type dipeptide/oligopeptide/nickel transport system ATPase subunit